MTDGRIAWLVAEPGVEKSFRKFSTLPSTLGQKIPQSVRFLQSCTRGNCYKNFWGIPVWWR